MRRLRLHLTGRPEIGLYDSVTGRAAAAAWDADGLAVEVFLADLEDTREEFDFATIDELTLEIRQKPTSTDLLAGPVSPEDAIAACTYDDWQDGTEYHARFELTGAQMNFASGISKVWLSVRATITNGEPVTFGAGWVTIRHSAHGDTETARPFVESFNEDGTATISVAGKLFEIITSNLRDSEDTGSSYQMVVESFNLDGTATISAGGKLFEIITANLRDA